MMYITGDTHGVRDRFRDNHMGDAAWTKDDVLLVCGDFQYLFEDNDLEAAFLDELEQTKPYTICFCDGNHENFTALYDEQRHPQELWHGGKVHRIRSNVLHLMRGQVFEIDGRSVFSMGGAYSIDRVQQLHKEASDGIKRYWKEELPTSEDYHEAMQNLKAHQLKVDIILSHTAPKSIIYEMGMYPDYHDMELTGFLDWIADGVAFGHWYFGHWHLDSPITERFTAVYRCVHAI